MTAAEDTTARETELPNLPVEILHRILTHGLTESALALCQANRKLHSVCYDPRVFLHLIHHRIVHDSFQSKQFTEDLGLDHETGAGVVAKWTLAVSRLDDDREDITTDVLRWAPHLQLTSGKWPGIDESVSNISRLLKSPVGHDCASSFRLETPGCRQHCKGDF